MRIVRCIMNFTDRANGPHPIKGECYEVEGEFPCENGPYLYIAGFYQMPFNRGQRIAYNPDHFRDVTFPPDLMEEVEECLQRELIEKI